MKVNGSRDATKVVVVSLDAPLAPLHVEERYRDVLLVVRSGGAVVGEVYLPAWSVIPTDVLASAISWNVGERVWRTAFLRTFEAAVGAGPGEPERQRRLSVSVVVATRDRPEQLRRCLESVLALQTQPDEIIVVDNCPSDERTRELVSTLPVRYLREDHPGASRARNRAIVESTADLLAFTDDDCTVDPHWLNGLDESFSDELVLAVTGYIGPAELETEAQVLFEAHGGFEKHFERTVFDGTTVSPSAAAGPSGASANIIFRRRAFEEVGLFAEDLGPGTPARSAEDAYQNYRVLAAGFRIAFEPSRIIWHWHRRELSGLRRILSDYTISGFAYTTRCLLRHHDLSVAKIWAWWLGHFWGDLRRCIRRRDDALPLRIALAEIGGMFRGPWRLYRSIRSRHGIPALELHAVPPPPAASRVEVGAEPPLLSVALPSRNRRLKLADVLEGLRRQDYPRERFDVTVVLDGSEDDSAAYVRSLDAPFRLTLLEQENRGLASTRNRGAYDSSGEVVVFLDDDTVPEPGFLAAHAAAHAASAVDHLVLGYYPPVITGGGLWAAVLRAWWEDHFRRMAEPGHVWSYIDFAGGNASFPRRLFLETGGFDESFRGRREDWEYALRLLGRGVRFAYHPEAKSLHYFDTSLETGLRHERQHAQDDVLIGIKHPAARALLPLAAFADSLPSFDEELARKGPGRARRYEAYGLRGRWSSLVRSLLRNAYAAGLRDRFPTDEAFRDYMSSIWSEGAVRAELDLARPAPFPPIAAAGAVELELTLAGSVIGSFIPVDPGSQWEWSSVGTRALHSLGPQARRAMVRDAGSLRDTVAVDTRELVGAD
jgi:glycosyltransferase involved in cell wall biosynthesis